MVKASAMKRVVVASRQVKEATFQLELVRCGKARCKRCPHGPYWYVYYYNPKTKKTTSRYVGKKAPWEEESEDGE